ncbi:MAG: hypothetical protein Q8P67_00010 [archaeon]|nr:hypothetical protein [archaeon]
MLRQIASRASAPLLGWGVLGLALAYLLAVSVLGHFHLTSFLLALLFLGDYALLLPLLRFGPHEVHPRSFSASPEPPSPAEREVEQEQEEELSVHSVTSSSFDRIIHEPPLPGHSGGSPLDGISPSSVIFGKDPFLSSSGDLASPSPAGDSPYLKTTSHPLTDAPSSPLSSTPALYDPILSELKASQQSLRSDLKKALAVREEMMMRREEFSAAPLVLDSSFFASREQLSDVVVIEEDSNGVLTADARYFGETVTLRQATSPCGARLVRAQIQLLSRTFFGSIERLVAADPVDPLPFLCVQRLPVLTLDAWLARDACDDRWEHVLHLLGHLAGALCYLHKRGVAHGDLCPSNVRLARLGHGVDVVLTGIARPSARPSSPALISDDIRALGLLFEQQVQVPGCPEELQRVVRSCLQQDPSLLPTAAELVARLHEAGSLGDRLQRENQLQEQIYEQCNHLAAQVEVATHLLEREARSLEQELVVLKRIQTEHPADEESGEEPCNELACAEEGLTSLEASIAETTAQLREVEEELKEVRNQAKAELREINQSHRSQMEHLSAELESLEEAHSAIRTEIRKLRSS